jgi:alginate O-acetyltransferase complex protein AlgI
MILSMLWLNPDGIKILDNFHILKVMVISAILFLSHWYMRDKTVKSVTKDYKPWFLGLVWAVMIFLISIAQGNGEQFIYFQF